MPPIDSILVANRGEIARRVFATCRRMGIASVAVYSNPDRTAPFVAEADQAMALGGAAPAESYLRGEAIIAAALTAGADAIHPGYGFLAESPQFAADVIAAGLSWIGPPPEAIAAMGSKLASKRIVEEAGVPTLASVDLTGLGPDEVAKAADDITYPVLVKASAGGGGKGMRIVTDPDDLTEAVAAAGREAGAAFGDDTLMLEAYLDHPRHIEIQVIADRHDNTVSLFERECSIQRRHQKIIEECPSPGLDEDTRRRMGEAAVTIARAVDYVGAGTVEFLYQDGDFHFLEMNTRLQVEHPVTEMVTGLDLVRLQILVAMGESLPAEALGARISGHAIEARLYAEDPEAGFLPVTGVISRFRFPERSGLRVDSGIEDGSEVSVHYDPLLAKVVAWAPGRREAAGILARSLKEAQIHGSITNLPLLVRILAHQEFLEGTFDTGFLTRHDPVDLGRPLAGADDERRAAVAAALAAQAERRQGEPTLGTIPSGWRNVPSGYQTVAYVGRHGDHEVGYRFTRTGDLEVAGFESVRLVEVSPARVALELDGWLTRHDVHRDDDVVHVSTPTGTVRLVELARFPEHEHDEQAGSLHAPMPGTVVRLDATEGATVADGQVLVVLEAMKMEHALRAPHAGVVTSVLASAGDQVEAGAVLVVVEGQAE